MDLNADGFQDLITGQYHPGDVTWFRGSEKGFLPGIKLEQHGDSSSAGNEYTGFEGGSDDPGSFDYWVYSSVSFGDFDDDGDLDLIVGGHALRISENIGTKTEPKFARREMLLDVNGNPLMTKKVTAEMRARAKASGYDLPEAGSGKTNPYVVDWDNDGVLDLIVTDDYRSGNSMAVAFFRGVKTDEGHRFEPGIDLLKTSDGSKALPGSGQRICVADWNQDGIQDLIIGASVATVNNGEFSDELSWEWEDVNEVESAGKDPGLYPPREKPTAESMSDFRREGVSDEDFQKMVDMNVKYWEESIGRLYKENKGHWLTMRHQGRIYVLLGEKRSEDASATETEVDSEPTVESEAPSFPMEEEATKAPLTYDVPKSVSGKVGEAAELVVTFDVIPGWYCYAPTESNKTQGAVATVVEFELPEGISIGDAKTPFPHAKGPYQIFEGEGIDYVHQIKIRDDVKPGNYTIAGKIRFQVCNKDRCLVPTKEDFSFVLTVE